MNLSDALTARIITQSTHDNCSIWVCAKCGSYLVYSCGLYYWTCQCNIDDGQELFAGAQG
jgi:hypothetical protein